MSDEFEQLKQWIADMALLMAKDIDIEPEQIVSFFKKPKLSLQLIDLIQSLNDDDLDNQQSYYSACIFALDICVAQLQSAQESGNKLAGRLLQQLMNYMAQAINSGKHSLGFWLPSLNAFYNVHVELSPELSDAYLERAYCDEEPANSTQVSHLSTMKAMIAELSDLSVFDIAENFFAQSYAMPADFFADLVTDLYSIDEGHDIALLMLLHPRYDVRDIVVATFDQLIHTLVLNSISLSRLKAIKYWYPLSYHEQFDRWIKLQRMKGAVFYQRKPAPITTIKASEVDGSGAQGIFIHFKTHKKNRICGLLLKQHLGIRDAWLTPLLSNDETSNYYNNAFEDSVALRDVDKEYLFLLTNHFLALTLKKDKIPSLHLLEIEELLGTHFQAQWLDIDRIINTLSVQIAPFTPEMILLSFKRSKKWIKNKRFAESWYNENANIDKLVNQCCSFVDGIKICALKKAIHTVITDELELHRQDWLFHFLWTSLWAKTNGRKNEKIWQDSFLIAYAMHSKIPLMDIPIMHEISRETVINSIDTMNERRTHLN
jgi:hypothetical protein